MSLFLLKELPRYECLQEGAKDIPGADASVCELYMNLLHTGEVIARAEAVFLSRFGLNQARMVLLFILDASPTGSMRSSELAEKSSVSRATITGILDTMEKAGLVARASDPNDRRASNVKITPAGEKLLAKVRPEFMRWSTGTVGTLSPQERQQLVDLLRKTRQSFEEPSSGSASRNGCHD